MRVLVGYDGGDGARDAIALTRVICTSRTDEALIVNVLPYGAVLPLAYQAIGIGDSAEVRQFFGRPRSELSGIEVQTRAFTGDSAGHVLTDLSESDDVDLVVVGSPHRGPLGRTFIGSVAERLLHGASRPLLIAPRGYAASPGHGLRVIAVAYDGSAEAALALKHAEALAAASDATLRLLTVAVPASSVPGVVAYTAAIGPDPQELIDRGIASIGPPLETESRCLTGPTATALADACEEGVDLLVTGSRGYGPLGRVFAGSVTSSLICKSPSPVLVVPRSADRGGKPEAASVSGGAADRAADDPR